MQAECGQPRQRGLGSAGRLRRALRALCLGACLVSAPAPAQPASENLARQRAAETFRQGVQAFDRRDFEAARVAFLQTLALKPDEPAVQRNLGIAEIYSGHYLDGARRLARVLQTTAEGSSEERSRMLESLKRAERYLSRLTIEVDVEGADIAIDGQHLGVSPLPFAWYVAPGPYEVRVIKPGFAPVTKRGVGYAGKLEHLRIVLEARPEPAAGAPLAKVSAPEEPPPPLPEAPPDRMVSRPNPWLIASGVVLAAAGVGAGLTFSVLAGENRERAEQIAGEVNRDRESCSPNTPFLSPRCGEIQRAYEQHDRQRYFALAGYAAGASFALLTLVYGVWLAPQERVPAASASATVPLFRLDRERAELTLRHTF